MFKQTWEQFERDGIVEYPEGGENNGFVVNVNPLQAVPKDETEMRPVMDCTKGGINE